jgi:hypothetical protein
LEEVIVKLIKTTVKDSYEDEGRKTSRRRTYGPSFTSPYSEVHIN